MRLGNMGANADDWDLVNLLFLRSSRDLETVWLISTYVLYVWEMMHVKKLEVKLDKFFGYLTFKYKMHQASSSDKLINLHYTYRVFQKKWYSVYFANISPTMYQIFKCFFFF